VQESALLRLAERQAGREEELEEARKRADEAEVRSEDLAQDVTLLQQQVAALKEVPPAPHLHCQNSSIQSTTAQDFITGAVDMSSLEQPMSFMHGAWYFIRC